MEFLEVVSSPILFDHLFVGVFAANGHINEHENEEPHIEYQHQSKPNPPHIEIQPDHLVGGRIAIDIQSDLLYGEDHSKHRQQHNLQHQSVDIPPQLGERPGQTEPHDLPHLEEAQHHDLEVAVGVEDGEGEHHQDLLHVGEDVVVVGLEVVLEGGFAAVTVLVLLVPDVL